MRCIGLITLALFCARATAQPVAEPQPLPVGVNDALPTGMAIVRFDPNQLELKRVDDRQQIWAGNQMLRDFGPLEREALEAVRLIRTLHFNLYGTVAGSTPPFEFWLSDGEGAKGGVVVKNIIAFDPATLQADRVLVPGSSATISRFSITSAPSKSPPSKRWPCSKNSASISLASSACLSRR